MRSFLCSKSVHNWERSEERYYMKNDHGKDHFLIKIRTCKRCKKRQAYTMIYALENNKKHWKDWNKTDGDYITWADLDP